MRTSWPAYCQLHFSSWIVFQYPYHLDSPQSCIYSRLSSSYPSLTLVEYRPRDSLTYCFLCVVYNVMRTSICVTYLQECQEQLPWVQVTSYLLHNSVNLPKHLLHRPLHLLLRGDGLGYLYIVYVLHSNGDNCPPCLILFEQWNVIDNELPHCTITLALYTKI